MILTRHLSPWMGHRGPGTRSRRRQVGLTLLELVISALLGLLVLSGVFLTYIGSGVSDRQSQALGHMTEDAQLALALITRELQMAGYMRITGITAAAGGRQPSVQLTDNHHPVQGCDNGFVQNNAAVASGRCAASEASPADDMPAIEITHEVTRDTSPLSASNQPTDCQGNGVSGLDTIVSNRFFVVRTGTGAGASYELHCASNLRAGQPLVPNVARLQFAYGFSADWDRSMPATLRPQRFVKAGDVTDWTRVVAVRVCVLMRSADRLLAASPAPVAGSVAAASPADYIGCDGLLATSPDGHLYRAFKTTVTLRNQVS